MATDESTSTATRPPRPEFIGHALSDGALRSLDRIRLAFSDCLDVVERETSPGRERALVLTKMQEACMWAVRSVAVRAPG